jgi:CRP/FNR family transcriptional activator FtrB
MLGLLLAQAKATEAATPLEGLECASWLESVPRDTLKRLAKSAMLHRAPRGLQLFEQAETPAFAQLLITGSIELLAVRGEAETLVDMVRPVDLLLPAAVLSGQPYLVRARVQEDAQLLLIQADAFRQAVASDHALALAVLAVQCAQFRRQMKQAKAVRLRSAEERIGCFLVAICEAEKGKSSIRLPLEKRQIASQLGMSRETLSRALPAMARHGLVVEGDMILVKDIAAARAQFPLDPLVDGAEPVVPLPLYRT